MYPAAVVGYWEVAEAIFAGDDGPDRFGISYYGVPRLKHGRLIKATMFSESLFLQH